jgi:hypothetical protein
MLALAWIVEGRSPEAGQQKRERQERREGREGP